MRPRWRSGSWAALSRISLINGRATHAFGARAPTTASHCTADHWYVGISIDTSDAHLPQAKNQGAVGVDFGVTHLVTLSTGEKVVGPKPLQTFLNRLRRLSRALSRKTKGSCNRSKAKTKLARLYAMIANIRAKYRVKPAPAKQESSGKLSRLSFV